MIPREISKTIRQMEIRTSQLVNDSSCRRAYFNRRPPVPPDRAPHERADKTQRASSLAAK